MLGYDHHVDARNLWVSWKSRFHFCMDVHYSPRPIILSHKAEKTRKTTGDNRFYAALERDRPRPSQIFEKVLARPLKMLFQEPMLIALNTYLSVGAFILILEGTHVISM